MRYAPVLALIVCVGLAVANADGVVLNIDPFTGCTRLNANTDVSYADDQTINALKMNRSSGGDVENCLVCDNSITITVPAFDASNVLADMPVFKGDKCTVKYDAADDAADDEFMCPPFAVGDGRMTANEQCDDGNAIDGDGCSSAGVLQHVQSTDPNKAGKTIYDSSNVRSADILRYQAIQNHTQGDGFISGMETYDVSVSLTDNCGSETKVPEICPNAGNCVADGNVNMCDRNSIDTLASYEVFTNGWRAPDANNDKAARIDIFKSGASNDFNEDIFVKVLDQHPELVSENLLVQTTKARRVVIQCVKNQDVQTQSTPILDDTDVLQVSDVCNTGDFKTCVLQNPHDEVFVAGKIDDDNLGICGVKSNTRLQADNSIVFGYDEIRVYVLAEQSGNIYVKHTVKSKTSNAYINYPSLIVLNFRAHITAADISQGLSASVSATSLTESENIQTLGATYSQRVELDGLSDAKFVRTVHVHANYAVRYDNVTSFSSSLVAEQNGKQTMYFGTVAGGAQDATSVFTIPAYENSPAQLNLLKFDALATLYSCDQFDGITAYTPVEEGSIRTELTYLDGLQNPYTFMAFNLNYDIKASKILTDQIVVGQFIKITPKTGQYSSNPKEFEIDSLSTFATSDGYYAVSFTVKIDDTNPQPNWGYAGNAQYIVEFIKASQAGRFGQFVSSDSISIQSVAFDVTEATEAHLSYTPSPPSISEGESFDAKFVWAPTGDNSLTRTWEHIECCDSGRDGFEYPDYVLQTTSGLTLDKFNISKCFRVKSSLELYDTDGRNAQLAGSGITVRVSPCQYASVDVTLKCRVKVTEPKIQGSSVSDDLQAAAEPASRFQYGAVPVAAVVQELSVANSFARDEVFTLQAGDASSTVDINVCTYVNDLVRSSSCDESEYVDEAKLEISGLIKNAANGNSYWVEPGFLSHGGLLSASAGNALVANPSFVAEANQTVCFTYTLSASSQASTCGTSKITLTRSHAVKEDSAAAYTDSQPAFLKINEKSCAVEIQSLSDVHDLEEDTSYALKDYYKFRRNNGATCGQHEEIKSVRFTIEAEYADKVKINDQPFVSNELVLHDDRVQPLGDKYTNEWRSFVDDVELTFATHFNTKGQAVIDLTLHIEVESCDGSDPIETSETRTIGIRARTDECYQDAVSDPIENANRVKAGNMIDQLFNATLSHIDERRSYKMTIQSNVPLSYQINRDGQLQPCGSHSYGNGDVTCTLYCSPDGKEPIGVSDAVTETYWDPNTLQCIWLKNLLLVPLYDENATTIEGVTFPGLPFECGSDSEAGTQTYCSNHQGGEAKSRTPVSQPYNGFLYLKFSSSISDDEGNTVPCFESGHALHRYDIEINTKIVGEIRAADGSAAVSVYDSIAQISTQTFNINGSSLNDNLESLALSRRPHDLYNLQQNGMFIALNISSNNCTDESDSSVKFILSGSSVTDLGDGFSGFNLDQDGYLSTPLQKDPNAVNKHVISNCQIVIDAKDTNDAAVFYPFYTAKAQFVYNVQASLGKAVVQLGGAYTPFDSSETSFTLHVARVGGSDGILTARIGSDVSLCDEIEPGTPASSTLNGGPEVILTWQNGNTDMQTIAVQVNGDDCAIKFMVNDEAADSQIAGQPGETWLTGELGSLYIAYSDSSADFASQTLLLGAGDDNGQEFTLARTKYTKPVKVKLTSAEGHNVTFTQQELLWEPGQDTSKTFRVLFNNKDQTTSLTHLRINAQMMVVKNTPNNYDTNAGGERLLTDEYSQQIPIVLDLSGPNACQWGKIESVATTGDVVAEIARGYSSYVDGYVRLSEGAEYFLGAAPDKYSLEVRRPASKEGDIKFKLNVANFDHASTGVFALTEDKLQQSIDNGAFEDFGDTITMSGTTTSITITIQVRNDDENNGIEQLALLYVSFEDMQNDLPPALADEIVAGCNANAAAGTSLNFNVQDEIQQASSTRRLLSVISGRRDTTILKVEDDVTEPFRQVQTSEDFAVEYWSNATLLQWDAAMDVGIQFDVPNYGDKPFGAWAQIGKCPTNVDTMFINRSSCSTFVPLANPGTTAIDYVRRLVGLDPSSNSTANCTGVDFPCNHRYSIPSAPGFTRQDTMNGHTITIDADGNTRPVYPYKYQNSLTELEKCLDYEGNAVVSTTSSDGDTAYTFKTCIVTYSPRFKDRTDSDVILKTAEQTVMLSSTNEAVVTGKWLCVCIFYFCVTHARDSHHV